MSSLHRSAAACTLLISVGLLLSPTAFAHRFTRCEVRNEARHIERLAQRVSQANLYASWAKPQCLRYVLDACSAEFVDIAIQENHGDSCDGDPATAPIVDRFRVYRSSERIYWYDVTNDEMRAFDAACSVRSCGAPGASKPASAAPR